jgi:2-dehydro-3-deoxygalactonokinase
MNELPCLICIDTGTTNTRVWLTVGDQIIASARAGVGVRDTARDGSPARLHKALRELIAQMQTQAKEIAQTPRAVLAAGMITSPLGLVEVPHVPAPAAQANLSTATQTHHFPQITDLPVLLVPGVRSGPVQCDAETIGAADVMRGEETLCVGLHALGLLAPGATLLNLGSHWKLIRLDEAARIAASVTSLTGELIHTTQTQTILASAVPQTKPTSIDQRWLEAGMHEQRQSGLARALFCVRLLEQRAKSTPEERLAFLLGVYLAADLDAWLRRGLLPQVVITGGGAMAEAWQAVLVASAIEVKVLDEASVEQGFLTGLRQIARASL